MKIASTIFFTVLISVLLGCSGSRFTCQKPGEGEPARPNIPCGAQKASSPKSPAAIAVQAQNDTSSDASAPNVADTETIDADASGKNAEIAPIDPNMWVVGSHPDYHWKDAPPNTVPYKYLTHLFLGFLQPAGSKGKYSMDITKWGPQSWFEWKQQAGAYIAAAHAANVKVVVDLGGEGGADEPFVDACKSKSNLKAFAQMITSTLRDMNFDGVDIDWEGDQYNAECVSKILHALRDAWPNGIIVTAVGPMYTEEAIKKSQATAAAADVIDALMMMTYIPPDQTWTWWLVPVPMTPLHGADTPWGGKQDYSIDRDRAVWTKLGVPANKLVMGISAAGKVWADTNDDGRAPNTPYSNYNELATDPACTQRYICNNGAAGEVAPIKCGDNHITQQWVENAIAQSKGKLTMKTDSVGNTTYWATPKETDLVKLTNPCNGETINVASIFNESTTSIQMKKNYVIEYGMKGFEIWTLSQLKSASGTYPLLEAFHK